MQPGAAPAQVAEGLARPIEDAFRGTTGIKHVSSTSLESVAIVAAEYEYGTDMAAAEREVRERLGAITFPTGVATPMVQRISLDSIPIVTMAVFGDDAAVTEALRRRSNCSPPSQAADGVAGVTKTGGSNQLVAVVVDPAAWPRRGSARAWWPRPWRRPTCRCRWAAWPSTGPSSRCGSPRPPTRWTR